MVNYFIAYPFASITLLQCVSDYLWCAVLLCFVVCMTPLASFFLPSSSLINTYISTPCRE